MIAYIESQTHDIIFEITFNVIESPRNEFNAMTQDASQSDTIIIDMVYLQVSGHSANITDKYKTVFPDAFYQACRDSLELV